MHPIDNTDCYVQELKLSGSWLWGEVALQYCRIPEGTATTGGKNPFLVPDEASLQCSDFSETNVNSKQSPYKALQKTS